MCDDDKSVTSQESYDVTEPSDSEEYADADVTTNEEVIEYEMNAELHEDILQFKQLYKDTEIECRELAVLNSVDVVMAFQTDVIFNETTMACKASGLDTASPIYLKLMDLSLSSYLSCHQVPQVSVYQTNNMKSIASNQLQQIIRHYLEEDWSNMFDERRRAKNHFPREFYSFGDVMVRLQEMGFTDDKIKAALLLADEDEDKALDLLLQSGASADRNDDQKIKKIKKARELTKKEVSVLVDSALIKERPNLQDGFFVQIYQYTLQRIKTLNEYCIICDEKHGADVGFMLKPTICSRPLCVFAHQSYGLVYSSDTSIYGNSLEGSEVDSATSTDPLGSCPAPVLVSYLETQIEVIDLLFQLALAAASSNRKELIFSPFPTIIDPDKRGELILHEGKRDFGLVGVLLRKIPSVRELSRKRGKVSENIIEKAGVLGQMLFDWIVRSCRSYIVKIPRAKLLTFVPTDYQFVMLMSSPIREVIFRHAKKIHGSKFAFHGSPFENWHSIIRSGLASSVKYRLHGNVYGDGIYCSPSMKTAAKYMYSLNQSHTPSEDGGGLLPTNYKNHLTCLSIVEVINNTDLKKVPGHQIWVFRSYWEIKSRRESH